MEEMSNIITKCKRLLGSFLFCVSHSSEKWYLFLLTVYILRYFFFYELRWSTSVVDKVYNLNYVILSIVIWGSAIYLYEIIAEWLKIWRSVLKLTFLAIILLLIAFLFSRSMSIDSFGWGIGIFLCAMSKGKDYIKILYVYLYTAITTLSIGLIGIFVGITSDASKPHRLFGGHSLGLAYPNNWGYMLFLILSIIWFLYLRKKWLLTIVIFATSSLVLYFFITSRTTAILTLFFPILATIADSIDEHKYKNVLPFKAIVILLPLIIFGITMILCWQNDWIRNHFYSESSLGTMAMRFVEGGYALRLNGLSFFGHPLKNIDTTIEGYYKEIVMIIDSAYVYYLIVLGVVWAVITLVWYSICHWKFISNKEYRLLAISIIMIVLATMERPSMNVWYNFLFLYPLADISLVQAKVSAGS